MDWIRERLAGEGKISPGDLDLFQVTDEPARVLEVVRSAAHRQARVVA